MRVETLVRVCELILELNQPTRSAEMTSQMSSLPVLLWLSRAPFSDFFKWRNVNHVLPSALDLMRPARPLSRQWNRECL